jgi:hypothetical protein
MTLEEIIGQESVEIGPLPVTGGVIHRLTDAQITDVAALIRAASSKWNVPLATLAGWICVESRFDPSAYNPNNQHALPDSTDFDEFLRADIGIAQIDGRYLFSWPGMAGLTWQAQKAQAFDPTWAVDAFASRAYLLLKSSRDPVDAYEAYNVGETGAALLRKQGELESYGLRVKSFVDKFSAAGIH